MNLSSQRLLRLQIGGWDLPLPGTGQTGFAVPCQGAQRIHEQANSWVSPKAEEIDWLPEGHK